MNVLAAVFRPASEDLRIERLQLDRPRDDEVLVRVVASGICHTDQKVRETGRTPAPIVLGHEGSGVVETVGASITRLRPGDHVVMTFDHCGRCTQCSSRHPAYCREGEARWFGGRRPDGTTTFMQDGKAIHGNFFGQSSFATYALCSERNAVKVRKDVPLALLGPLACGIQTGAGAVLNAFGLKPGQSIAVFGAGSVGLSAIMAARLAGASRIIALDVVGSRLALAGDLGATDIIDVTQGNAADRIQAITRGGADFALDTTGIPATMLHAIAGLAPRGVFGFVANTQTAEPLPLPLGPVMADGKHIVGIVQGDSEPHSFIPMLLDLHVQGRFPFDRMVTYYDFEQVNAAFADCRDGRTIKPILRISDVGAGDGTSCACDPPSC